MPILTLILWAAPALALPWRESLPEALEEARVSGRPVLIDFSAPWCYSCYYMDKHVLGREKFEKAARGLVLLKVDVDRAEGLALKQKYGVTFLPTYVLADSGGRALGRIVGEQREGDFLHRLEGLLAARAAADPLDKAVESLRARLAANEYDEAAREMAGLPKDRLKSLGARKDWTILFARLSLMRAVRQGRAGGVEALKVLVEKEASCELAYDISYGEKLLEGMAEVPRKALLEAERTALGKLLGSRHFVTRRERCADFRTGIEALAKVHEGLGDKPARAALLSRAISVLEGEGLRTGEDRNRDDDLRFFLELAGEDSRLRAHFKNLIAAYPADYVYAFRFARYLQSEGDSSGALPYIEKADKLSYGANRLAVTKLRARLLADLGRAEEARALLKRDYKAGEKSFPKEAAALKALLEELSK